MKFAKTLSETVSLAEIKNSSSDFELVSKRLRKFENTAEFPRWGIERPGELRVDTCENQVVGTT